MDLFYKYYDNDDVIWILHTDSNWKLSIIFSSFSTEQCCDHFRAGNGANYTDNILVEWSGNHLPSYPFFRENTMWLSFTSDGINADKGFSLTVTSVPLEGNCLFTSFNTFCLNDSLHTPGAADFTKRYGLILSRVRTCLYRPNLGWVQCVQCVLRLWIRNLTRPKT